MEKQFNFNIQFMHIFFVFFFRKKLIVSRHSREGKKNFLPISQNQIINIFLVVNRKGECVITYFPKQKRKIN